LIDVGQAAVKRIPLNDPTRGTRDLVGTLMDETESAEALVSRLSA
jgi:proteasome accessory factor A